jgi:hypothetical protein
LPKRAVLLAISVATAILLIPNAFGSSVAIVNGSLSSPELSTTELITNNLVLLETLAGNTVTVYNSPPSSLAGFSSVWDISWFDSAALTPTVDTEYTNYMAGGGDLVLIGENTIASPARDASIVSLIDQLGGSILGTFDDCDNNGDTQTVNGPFTGPNPVSSVTYQCSAGFLSFHGTSFITQLLPSVGTGVVYAPGTLSGAPHGALLSLLDSNFMQGNVGTPSQNLLENLIGYVDNLGPPGNTSGPTVPEPASTVLIGAGLLGLAIARKRRPR